MAGGLIQLVTYGSQDLYLTGTPEITYFKVVYRRHTNFSVESLSVNFNDNVGFGTESSLIIPKIGDLVGKTYLEIILPEINLKKISYDLTDEFINYDTSRDNYNLLLSFMRINREAYTAASDIFLAANIETVSTALDKINEVFDNINNSSIIDNFKILLTGQEGFKYDEISLQEISKKFTTESDMDDFVDALNIGLDKSIKTQNLYRLEMLRLKEIYKKAINPNITFAWVDRIGHSIIEYIDIYIGGQKIDKHLGDWINIWYELSANRNMEETYKKMIGDVEILTNFDNKIKPEYKLKIPLQFWFCRHGGLSIPLVAMQYHNVSINVKFRKIEEVAYIKESMIYVSKNRGEIFIEDVPEELKIDIKASIHFDYIYLDSQERKRFAQSSHEYLIEQVQTLDVQDIREHKYQLVLDNFVHPVKEIIWRIQKDKYVNNNNGNIKNRWNNYSLTDENKGNPIRYSSIDFHSYTRVPRLEGNYYNYLQPYEYHNTTPSDGINMYSFSLYPEEYQPSGTANFSRLSRILLTMEFDKSLKLADTTDINRDIINLKIYVRNYNILRFVSGTAGLAMTYG